MHASNLAGLSKWFIWSWLNTFTCLWSTAGHRCSSLLGPLMSGTLELWPVSLSCRPAQACSYHDHSSKRDRERQRKRKKVGRRGRVKPLEVLGGNWCAVPASWGREIGLLDEMSFRVMDVWLQRVEQLQPFFANHLSYLPTRSMSPWWPGPLIFQQKPETSMFPQVKCWHPVQTC